MPSDFLILFPVMLIFKLQIYHMLKNLESQDVDFWSTIWTQCLYIRNIWLQEGKLNYPKRLWVQYNLVWGEENGNISVSYNSNCLFFPNIIWGLKCSGSCVTDQWLWLYCIMPSQYGLTLKECYLKLVVPMTEWQVPETWTSWQSYL